MRPCHTSRRNSRTSMDTGPAQVCVLVPVPAYEELPAHALANQGAEQTLLDTLPNLDDHRLEDGCRTMDVGSWLRSLELDQYEANFRDNKIDADAPDALRQSSQ